MKTTIKKLIPLFIIAGSLTSCTYYSVKPGPLKNLVGTYELAKYEMKHNESDEETYDRKAELGAVAYFSIAADGYSYYVYKDNKTAPKFSTMFGTFSYNSEEDGNPEYVRSVSIKDGVTHLYEDQKYVGCFDEPSMGFRDDVFQKTLHYNLSGHMLFQPNRKIPYQYVQYKRVSTEASLAKVNELMGTHFKVNKPFECKALSGYLVYRCNAVSNEISQDGKGLYDYAILDANSYTNGKFTVYYALKSDHVRQSVQVPVKVEKKGYSFSLPFQGSKFYGEKTGDKLAVSLGTKPDEYPSGSLVSSESFTRYYSDDLSLNEIIDREKEPANSSFVVHNIVTGQKEYAVMQQDYETGVLTLNGLELNENEEFVVFAFSNNGWKYFEDYVEEGTASGKVVEGSKADSRWGSEGEEEVHYLRATESGEYDLTVDTSGHIHIVHS